MSLKLSARFSSGFLARTIPLRPSMCAIILSPGIWNSDIQFCLSVGIFGVAVELIGMNRSGRGSSFGFGPRSTMREILFLGKFCVKG